MEKVKFNRFRLFFDETSKNLVGKMETNSIEAGKLLSLHVGIRPKIGYENISSKSSKGPNWRRGITSGSEVKRYHLSYEGYYINVDQKLLWGGGFDEKIIYQDKLLMRKTGDSLVVALDDEKLYHLDILHSIILKNGEYSLKYLMAIFNSKIMNYYYHLITLSLRRVMAQTNIETIEQLPVPKIDFSNPSEKAIHDKIVALADRMLALNKELHEINTDFDRYVNLYSRTKDTSLKDYIDKLPVGGKEVMNDHYGRAVNRIEGKIKEFEIIEEGDWLVFKVGYIFKTSKGKELLIKNVRAFRCRFEDEKLRKFIYYSIKEYTTPGKVGRGNIYDRILRIKVPRFNVQDEENRKVIGEIMDTYLVEVGKRERLTREIDVTDQEIDKQVYELYGLSEEEIRVVEGGR